uniref:Single stranded DNA binding protein 4 n=1 Tax=Oryzias sinensis TaxID=183150 RepID=A0A8C8DJY1_9TELE
MYGKGKGAVVPSDSQAREKLALYVYEYLLHVGAQKSAQTFLSEIRWEKNITLGEPPGFLHSWWCVFWDLYCAAPDRRETCEHSSEAKAFHDYSAAAAPSPVMGNMPPNDAMPGGPMPPGFFQVFHLSFVICLSPSHPPSQCLTLRNKKHLIFHYCVFSSPLQIAYSSSSPGNYVGPPGGGGPPGTPIMPSPGDSTNSSENIYTMMNPIGAGGNRPNFPMGPGPDGPMGAMGAMEPHHMNGSLGSGDMDGLPKNSPNNMGGMNNPPGTPRDDGEMGGNFLNPFQSESVSKVSHHHVSYRLHSGFGKRASR